MSKELAKQMLKRFMAAEGDILAFIDRGITLDNIQEALDEINKEKVWLS